MKALIIVDMQYDFTTGGSLEVPGGESIIGAINKIQPKFDVVVATQDWHPGNHVSFASNHPFKKPFDIIDLNGQKQTLWPDHCVQTTHGARIRSELDMKRVEAIFRKGVDPEIDSYSGFFDNNHRKATGLAGYLREKGVRSVYVCGLAADICVYYTAKDALGEGFKTFLIEDASMPLDSNAYKKAKSDLERGGASIINSFDLDKAASSEDFRRHSAL